MPPPYQAVLPTPFGALGIRTDAAHLLGIDFLSIDTPALSAVDALARETCRQLEAYFSQPDFRFSLALAPQGTPFQQKLWHTLMAIPRGQTRTYGELARLLGSAALAVGQACGANPIPIIIPCHRVLGKNGLGGFMHHRTGDPLAIKRWLLDHEQARY